MIREQHHNYKTMDFTIYQIHNKGDLNYNIGWILQQLEENHIVWIKTHVTINRINIPHSFALGYNPQYPYWDKQLILIEVNGWNAYNNNNINQQIYKPIIDKIANALALNDIPIITFEQLNPIQHNIFVQEAETKKQPDAICGVYVQRVIQFLETY